MKIILAVLFCSSVALALPQKNTVVNKANLINIENEIQLIQQNTIAKEKVFKVIDVKKNSTFKDLGYKKGDLINKIDNETIFNKSQLKAALNRQATEWESTSFDNDFSEGEIDIDQKSFDQIEKELED